MYRSKGSFTALDLSVFGIFYLDICISEVLSGQNKEVLDLTYYVYLNILAVHLNVYIKDICRTLGCEDSEC